MPAPLALPLLLSVAQLQRDPFAALVLPTTRPDAEVSSSCEFHLTAIIEDGDETVALGVVPTSGEGCAPQVLRVGDRVTPHFGRIARIDAQGMEVVTEYLTVDGELVVERVLLALGEPVSW